MSHLVLRCVAVFGAFASLTALCVATVAQGQQSGRPSEATSPSELKDSREQFEVRVRKRLIDILDPSPETVDALMGMDLPTGVDIEIKL